MDFAKIRPRGGTKAQWEKANPVLAKREIGVQWETTIGVGEVVIKIGDGVNNWINLPEAVKSDITKKIIAALAVVPDDDPDLADGDSLDTLFGKIAKKFKYLKDNKLDKSARYDGTDSTSTELVPTANALRGVNAKADKNASDIMTLNNNLSQGNVIAYFSPMRNNEANMCKGYNWDNGNFIFNYHGATSKIKDYVFGDGAGGVLKRLSELASKDDLVTKYYTQVGKSLPADATTDFVFDVTLSGYTPLGIIGTRFNSYGRASLVHAYISGNSANVRLRNNGTSDQSGENVAITVLYKKS